MRMMLVGAGLLVSGILAGAGCSADAGAGPDDSTGSEAKSGAFAVVELFTSEGCSSCPPADEVLAEMVKDAREKHLPVYSLAFHVDYWNRLGWVDKFSSAAFTRRQETYARVLGASETYTPQMLVNGAEPFIGSERPTLRKRVKAALGREGAVGVKLEVVQGADAETVRLVYKVTGAGAEDQLNVALVERGLKTDVARGENAGHALVHENVVRVFDTSTLSKDGTGTVTLKVPAGVKRENASIIAYVQNPRDMKIIGALGAEFPK